MHGKKIKIKIHSFKFIIGCLVIIIAIVGNNNFLLLATTFLLFIRSFFCLPIFQLTQINQGALLQHIRQLLVLLLFLLFMLPVIFQLVYLVVIILLPLLILLFLIYLLFPLLLLRLLLRLFPLMLHDSLVFAMPVALDFQFTVGQLSALLEIVCPLLGSFALVYDNLACYGRSDILSKRNFQPLPCIRNLPILD